MSSYSAQSSPGPLVHPLEDVPRSYLQQQPCTPTYAPTTSPYKHNDAQGSPLQRRCDPHMSTSSSVSHGGTARPSGGTLSPTNASAAPIVTAATADFQRGLVQQQLQQAQRELRQLKDELYDSSAKLGQATARLNEQRLECSAVNHRYSTTVDKLTSAEVEVKNLEQHVAQERMRANTLREEREELRLKWRDAQEECRLLQRELQTQAANRSLDHREVQRLLQDRTQYVPTIEVRRQQLELKESQLRLQERLTAALDTLWATAEEGETNVFVARSAVLSTATDLEARVLRAEAALTQLQSHLSAYTQGLEAEASDFLLALMTENKKLWEHLTKLQSAHDLVVAELELKQRRGEAVPADKHAYVVRQLQAMTDRMQRAQQLVEVQTAVSREHETQMRQLMADNAALTADIDEKVRTLTREQEEGQSKTAALGDADRALAAATQQIRALQGALVTERSATEATVQRLTSTHTAMQEEYEGRLRVLQADRTATEETVSAMERDLEESRARIASLEHELAAHEQQTQQEKARRETLMTQQQESYRAEVESARTTLEEALASLRAQVAEARQEARTAVLARDVACAESQSSKTTTVALEAELAEAHREAETMRLQVVGLQEELRASRADREALSERVGTSGTSARELELRLQRAQEYEASQVEQFTEEKVRLEQRCQQVEASWHGAEAARASLQEELKLMRMRCAEFETARVSQERRDQDRAHLMKENLRLHEQHQCAQHELHVMTEQLKKLRNQQSTSTQLSQQIQDLEHRLRELPQLRIRVDEVQREAIKAKEEADALRQDRDELHAKLDFFLEESKVAAEMDAAFGRVVHDAGEAVRRLGTQMGTAKEHGGSDVPSVSSPQK